MQLPPDIYSEIQKYLPLLAQPAFRQASKQTLAAQFDWQTQCCTEPTAQEIADWIREQQANSILNEGISVHLNKHTDFANPPYTRNILIDQHTGKISDGNDYSAQAIPAYLIGQYTKNFGISYDIIDSDEFNQWLIVRDILSKRRSCLAHGFDSDSCFIKLLRETLPQDDELNRVYSMSREELIVKTFTIMQSILSPEAAERFALNFARYFNM